MIQKMSRREQLMVLAAMVTVVLVAIWLGVVEPYRSALAKLDSQISTRESSLDEVKKLQQDILRLQQQLAGTSGRKEMDGPLFSHVERMTDQVGVRVNLLSMRPQPTTQQGEYRQQLVELKLEKLTIPQLVRFLYAIEYSGQGTQVKSLRIKRRFDDHSSLDVNLTLFSLEKS
ncbi:MAG: type II secretion system protein GspM [Desulfuromonadales bacterium]|jgi:general secretion pathway protein M|nr:type II secretion system protein GspM [Desulfuromonadales bacterium]